MKQLPRLHVSIYAENVNGGSPVFSCLDNQVFVLDSMDNTLKIGVPILLPEKSAEVLFLLTEEKNIVDGGWEERLFVFTSHDQSCVMKFHYLFEQKEGQNLVWEMQDEFLDKLISDEGNKALSKVFWDYRHILTDGVSAVHKH